MAFEELKERQSVMWGNGAFDRIAASIDGPARIGRGARSRRAAASAARPRLRHGRGRGADGAVRCDRRRHRPRAGADRDGEGAGRRARPRDRLPRRRLRAARRIGDVTYDAVGSSCRDHVRAGSRGGAAELARITKPGGRHRARRTGRRRPASAGCLQGHGSVPARAAAVEPVRLGRRDDGRASCSATRSTSSSRRGSTPSRTTRVEDYWQDFVDRTTGRRSRCTSRSASGGEELHQAWLDCVRRRRATATSRSAAYLLVTGHAPLSEVVELLPAADPRRHDEPAGQRDRGGRAAARLPRGGRRRVRAVRARARAREPRRAHPRPRRRPVARAALAHRRRARRRGASGSATRSAASSSTARSGAAARST